MARGFLNIAGGLLTGIGQGMVAQDAQAQKRGMEEREARRRELERKEDMAFKRETQQSDQTFTAGQNELQRGTQQTLQTQRLTAEQEEAKLNRANQTDVAKINQAGRSSSRYQPLPNPTEDGFLQYFDRETGETLVSANKMGARPGTEKADDPGKAYADAVKEVQGELGWEELTPAQYETKIRAAVERRSRIMGGASSAAPAPESQNPTAAAGTYNSANDVRDAMRRGEITRDQARQLIVQFGYK